MRGSDGMQGAATHWGDESGLGSNDVRGRAFAHEFHTPVIHVKRMCHGLSIISTIAKNGNMR